MNSERVLVCLLASTRAHKLTFPSFKKYVLDELDADLALALAINENYNHKNPLWQSAKYRWTVPDMKDYGKGFDMAQRSLCEQFNIVPTDWRLMLELKGLWQGGIRTPNPQPTASALSPFCRWLLLNGLHKDGILNLYDRFVITRSDFLWLCPHPPLSILDRHAIWIPDGEDYGGVNDRHLVVSRADVADCLNVLNDIVLQPTELYAEMRNQRGDHGWNNEFFFAQHLRRKGLFHKIKRFPYFMYLGRSFWDRTATWSPGRYEPAVGHYIKYEREYRAACNCARLIRSGADWKNVDWEQVEAEVTESADPRSPRFHLRIWYVSLDWYLRIHSALRRPGRTARFFRFLRRMVLNSDRIED